MTQAALDAAVTNDVDLSRIGDVLVVDDDPVMLEVATVMLERLGIGVVHTALDGYGGLERLSYLGDSCRATICDLDMPGIDGIEFLRRVIDLGWAGGLIFVSGTDERLLEVVKEIGRARAVTGLETLTKPMDCARLAAALKRVTSRPRPQGPRSEDPGVTPEELSRAIDSGELLLEYQPKVDARTRLPVGCEALVRWLHPRIGRIGPHLFVPVAERSGLINRMTAYVAERATRDLSDWGLPGDLHLAINVSMQDLQDLDWPNWLTGIVESNGISTSQVTLEVTESSAFADLADSLEILARCRLKGFGLSIDDFGTGFSSLEKLSYVPFTELKIDRRFVQEAPESASARTILQASVQLAAEMSMSTVAEGVETEEQLRLVRSLGCRTIQGFLFAKPMAASDFAVWYRAQMSAQEQPGCDRSTTRSRAR